MENEQNKPKGINWKNILIGVVIGVVLIGLGVLIFLILQPKPEPTTTVTTKKATPAAKISTPSAEKDETADWETYTGETISVSFKIPQNFIVKDQKGKIQNTWVEGLITVSDEKGEQVFSVNIIHAGGEYWYSLDSKGVVIDGIKGTKTNYTFSDPITFQPKDQIPKFIVISFKEKEFTINYDIENEEFVNKVLPTFKILD